MKFVRQGQWHLPWFYTVDAYFLVTGVSVQGWFTTRLSLRGFARARANLAKLDILHVELVGALGG